MFATTLVEFIDICSNTMVGRPLLGIAFEEVISLNSSKSKVLCCHFSSDGKLLASGGHEKKVVWVNPSSKFRLPFLLHKF